MEKSSNQFGIVMNILMQVTDIPLQTTLTDLETYIDELYHVGLKG